MYLFVQSFIHSFVDSSNRSFVQSFFLFFFFSKYRQTGHAQDQSRRAPGHHHVGHHGGGHDARGWARRLLGRFRATERVCSGDQHRGARDLHRQGDKASTAVTFLGM